MARFIFFGASLALTAVCLSGCGHKDLSEPLQSGRVMAISGVQGRWSGPVEPQGTACGATGHGLMSIGGKTFAFDPFQSTTVINGTIDDSGHLTGRLQRVGGDHQDLSIAFDGSVATTADSETITGTIKSGRCTWSVTLQRH